MRTRLTRRQALALGASATIPFVHMRTAGAAGKVSLGLWDHWVPAGDDVMRKQVNAWAEQNKVEVQLDFITSNGFKNLVTLSAEEQAKSGHDISSFPNFEVHNHAASMEPVDDVVGRLIGKFGPINQVSEYLFKVQGHWLSIPSSWGSQNKGPCGRISVLKELAGLDVQKMYPAQPVTTPEAEAWDWEAHQKAAEACQKGGKTFGIGLGVTADSVDMTGCLLRSFGAKVVDEKGDITVDSDPVRHVLEYAQRMVKVLPDDAVAYDDASNNRALISGQSALIWNPPSAWAVAVRDNPSVGADCWTFPSPKGPAGRFMPVNLQSFGIWKFSPNKSAAKELAEWLMQREQVEERAQPVQGYDQPPFISMTDFKIWEEVQPPKGTVYNYPIRPFHKIAPWLSGMEAPPETAVQIYNRGTLPTMLAKLKTGQSIPQVIAWAKNELEGFI
ncbi:MAG: extracellular solute-binding protein [Acetobacteraceae bacterium]|nr:extracellular solute-binding protein [Acetobacteraceae bacterium]